ncbi:ABC transporter ATP-binding protein [Nonomuraea jabiensis]|uniref:ATP-binding cassette subfamily B protein n=1 Tax=Nonomuraea jabiensis TaxID=882448 RepID=A0A7W9G0H8_9ACTN|nr:ATP-binding cassette domain-containing protein [Nonomuraea jabiensis]MBB5774965.1 ATP-binding cassette subfamily B protein [Nonomuraea jabiensis]
MTGLVRERARLVRLLRLAGRARPAALIACLLLAAAAPAAMSLAAGWLVGAIAAGGDVVAPLATLAAVLLVQRTAESLQDPLGATCSRSIDGHVRTRVRQIALRQRGIAHLEDEEFQDLLSRASDRGESWRVRSPGTAATGQLMIVFRAGGAVAAGAILAGHFPLLALLLVAGCLLQRSYALRQWSSTVSVEDGLTSKQRRTEYWAEVASGAEAAKEVRMFGLADWVMERRLRAHTETTDIMWTARMASLRRQAPVAASAAVMALAALLVPGIAAATGRLAVDGLATCLAAAWAIFQATYMGQEALDIAYGLGALRALDQLDAPGADPGGEPARYGPVRFENVTFAYPGAAEPVLRGLDLTIEPGEVLAIVGVNGAGKTTLSKLLTGLYTPSAGRILVDGADLRRLDVESWRRHIAVVFQDFVHYSGSVRDNIRLSAPEIVASDDDLRRAIHVAGASDVIEDLPAGLDTSLWHTGTGGTDLSGGQWQRLALARALFAAEHGRRLLILDEPTANLDIQAETQFYQQVIAGVPGTTVVLISHRLSTVQHADRIVVLDGGRIIESGGHADLLRAGGAYARLFRLQAERFTAAS